MCDIITLSVRIDMEESKIALFTRKTINILEDPPLPAFLQYVDTHRGCELETLVSGIPAVPIYPPRRDVSGGIISPTVYPLRNY
jgi:hypothetical protein